jgi:hypothetical protein
LNRLLRPRMVTCGRNGDGTSAGVGAPAGSVRSTVSAVIVKIVRTTW